MFGRKFDAENSVGPNFQNAYLGILPTVEYMAMARWDCTLPSSQPASLYRHIRNLHYSQQNRVRSHVRPLIGRPRPLHPVLLGSP